MRVIDLTKTTTAELWPGRRLVLHDKDGVHIFNLPKSAMSQHRTTILFGSGRSAVNVTGSEGMVAALAQGLYEMEKPKMGAHVVKVVGR